MTRESVSGTGITMTGTGEQIDPRQQRRRTLKQGFAGWTGLHSVVECTVRDISEGGARLEFSDTTVLPTDFELTVPIDGTIQPCTKVWTRHNMIGVRFTAPARVSKLHKRDQVLTAYRPDEHSRTAIKPPSRAVEIIKEAETEFVAPKSQPVAFGRRGR